MQAGGTVLSREFQGHLFFFFVLQVHSSSKTLRQHKQVSLTEEGTTGSYTDDEVGVVSLSMCRYL